MGVGRIVCVGVCVGDTQCPKKIVLYNHIDYPQARLVLVVQLVTIEMY